MDVTKLRKQLAKKTEAVTDARSKAPHARSRMSVRNSALPQLRNSGKAPAYASSLLTPARSCASARIRAGFRACCCVLLGAFDLVFACTRADAPPPGRGRPRRGRPNRARKFLKIIRKRKCAERTLDARAEFNRLIRMKKLGPVVFAQLAMLGHKVVHLPELDEAKPLPERFSGGYYVGAKEKNRARLQYRFDNATQIIYCGKYALRALFEQQAVYVGNCGEAQIRKWIADACPIDHTYRPEERNVPKRKLHQSRCTKTDGARHHRQALARQLGGRNLIQ